jgi:hypothetical protein
MSESRADRIRQVWEMTDRHRWYLLRWIAANEAAVFDLAIAATATEWDEPDDDEWPDVTSG